MQTQVKSTAFVSYIIDQVLPHQAAITGPAASGQKLDIFKLLAELSSSCGPLDPVAPRIQTLYNTLVVTNIFQYVVYSSLLNVIFD